MNINLIYNNTAGNGGFSLDAILESLYTLGATVNVKESHSDDLGSFLEKSCDFYLIAGGDGTVEKIMKKVVKNNLPLAIFPVGSANNIAKSLNLNDYLEQIVQNWKSNKLECLSLGSLHYSDQHHLFVESVGWGLFSQVLKQIKSEKEEGDSEPIQDKVSFGLEKLSAGLAQLQPVFFEIKMDGKDYSGEYLWIEVMNTQFMGPQLNLAPNAKSNDVFLDVFMVKKVDKKRLENYFQERESFYPKDFLPTIKAKKILIRTKGPVHVDDEVIQTDEGNINLFKLSLYSQLVRVIKSSFPQGMFDFLKL